MPKVQCRPRASLPVCVLIILTCLSLNVQGQGLTGQISATVRDSSGGAVVGASVELVNSGTGQIRKSSTDSSGTFLFAELLPGQYAATVTNSGFKKYTQENIVVLATQRVALRPIVLELGAVSDSVSVTAETAQLATQSAERSGSLSTSQILETPSKGRNFMSLLSLVPGIINVANEEYPGSGGLGDVKINGSRGENLTLNMDGVPIEDTGNQNGNQTTPSLEAIGELKVLSSNYQAEYGRSYGGVINTVIKAGTNQFHGGAYYFKRNEAFNANNFFSNRSGLVRPRYRYDLPGYFLGGPALFPGLVKTRDKLFFFWSQEFLPRKTPTALGQMTFPTALERSGDFSQTLDTNRVVIPIQDPLNNHLQFPGNKVPANRIDPVGQALLNQFPMPTISNPTQNYNDVFQSITNAQHRFEVARVDWNITNKTTSYVRAYHSRDDSSGPWTCCGNSYPEMAGSGRAPARGILATVIHTFSPTLVNETTVGVSSFKQFTEPDPASASANNRTALGVNFPQLFPQNNLFSVLPNTTFGGVQNAPSIAWEQRFPFGGTGNIWTFTDNLSKIWGAHNFKAGVYLEKAARNAVAYTPIQSYMGTVSFNRDTTNPLDTNYAFSNAILGTIDSYFESSTRPVAHDRYASLEWFVQDNWKITKRLTFDLGMRFYHIVPTSMEGETLAKFDPTQYTAANAPKLVQPYQATPGGARVGINPATGDILAAALIGSYAPGSGQAFDGMRTYQNKILFAPALSAAPRFGFAWDVFGNGKMAVRGGFGIFPGRIPDDRTGDFLPQPPGYHMVNFYNTTIKSLAATSPVLTPSTVLGLQNNYKPPATYSWSFGIQKDVGFATVLDVSYVALVTRHLQIAHNLNAVPYGTNFLPSSIDHTVGGNTPLPLNFLRPMPSYADVNYYDFSSNANYQSMQTQLNRRLKRDLVYGVAWTWSKMMDIQDSLSVLNPFIDPRTRAYGKAGFDRTHTLVSYFNYTLPKASKGWSNPLIRAAFDNWEVAGVVSFISGAPLGISYTLTGPDIMGGGGAGVDTRVNVISDPLLPRGERTPLRAFRTEAIAMPSAATFGIGNAPKNVFRGPGINNWDLSMYKEFPLGKEVSRMFQFRFESYNAFNHTQFSSVNTAARFDSTTGNQINTIFGQYTAARDGRRLQLGVKFYF